MLKTETILMLMFSAIFKRDNGWHDAMLIIMDSDKSHGGAVAVIGCDAVGGDKVSKNCGFSKFFLFSHTICPVYGNIFGCLYNNAFLICLWCCMTLTVTPSNIMYLKLSSVFEDGINYQKTQHWKSILPVRKMSHSCHFHFNIEV